MKFRRLTPLLLLALPSAYGESIAPYLNSRTYSLWLRTNGGLYAVANDHDLKSTGSGFGVSLAGGAAFTTRSLVFSAGLGWSFSSIGVTPSAAFADEFSDRHDDLPSTLTTSYAYVDASLGYRLNPTTVLAIAMLVPFGVDTRFTIRDTESDSLPHPFAGVDIRVTPSLPAQPTHNTWWYGVSLLKDLTIDNRDVYQALLSITYNIPVSYEVERPILVYKKRYQLREKLVTTIKDRHFISLGILYFENEQGQLSPSDAQYLAAVAEYLSAHPRQWGGVLIGSNQRSFDDEAKKLIAERLAAITVLLQESGIESGKIKNYELEKQEGAESIFDAPEAVDISIVGERDVEELKSKIVHLMQQFTIPDTCHDGKCL